MAIFVTGDTHGIKRVSLFGGVDGFMNRLNDMSFPEQKHLTKDDFVVICGDFGGVWDWKGENAEEKLGLDWLESKSFTTLFVPGNHENYDRLMGINDDKLIDSWMFDYLDENTKKHIVSGYPLKEWHGGMVRELRPSVLMLERGYVFDIDGKKCFAFGGAASHDISGGILNPLDFKSEYEFNNEYMNWYNDDRMFRVKHISWWEQEMPSKMEMERGWAMLEDEKYKMDFIFTHDGPYSSKSSLLYRVKSDELTRYLEHVKAKVDYKKWFFGHLHMNQACVDVNDICLYEQILRIN